MSILPIEWEEFSQLIDEARTAASRVKKFSEGGQFEPAYQLGEVSYHLKSAVRATDQRQAQEQLKFARWHCGRAIYDSYDLGIHVHLKWFYDFKKRYAKFQHKIPDYVKKYIDIQRRAENARRLTIKARKESKWAEKHGQDKDSPPLKSVRHKYWAEAKDCFELLDEDMENLRAAREVLDAMVKAARRKQLYIALAVLGTFLALPLAVYEIFKEEINKLISQFTS